MLYYTRRLWKKHPSGGEDPWEGKLAEDPEDKLDAN